MKKLIILAGAVLAAAAPCAPQTQLIATSNNIDTPEPETEPETVPLREFP